MEEKYPNAAIMVMGDFNNLKFKLPSYEQVVTKHRKKAKFLTNATPTSNMPIQCATN